MDKGLRPSGFIFRGGEQPRAAVRPSAEDPLLLFSDGVLDFLVDGDEGFAFHLAVGVAQIQRVVAAAYDAVERDLAGVADA